MGIAVQSTTPGIDLRAEGLRGIASLNVLLSHYFACFFPILMNSNYPGIFPAAPQTGWGWNLVQFPLFNIFYNGHFAVMVFFVLSGYVLTLPVRQRGDHGAIQRRFWGRYLRLNLPVMASILLSWALLSGGFYLHDGVSPQGAGAMAVMLGQTPDVEQMLTEGFFLAIFTGNSMLNPPLWSIGAEFIGSILLLAFFFPPGRRKWALVLLVFLLGASVYTNSATYLVAIFAGAFIAKARPGPRMIWALALLGIYFGGYQQSSIWYGFLHLDSFLPSTKNVVNMTGAICLTIAIINGFARKLTLHPAAQTLGRIAFPLYILHYPILGSAAIALYGVLPPVFFVTGVHLVVVVALCLGVAMVFERVIDQPAIVISKRAARAVMAWFDAADQKVRTRAM